MRFLIVNTDYWEFLNSLYSENPALESKPYEEQMRARMESLFGVADFYSSNLRKLGHEAFDIHANNELMQAAWAREHGIRVPDKRWRVRMRRKVLPWLTYSRGGRWLNEVLAAQIKHFKPDVLLNQAMEELPCAFFKEIKPHVRLLVGQHAATRLPEGPDWGVYDLVVSSFPPTVDWFRSKGAKAQLSRLAFEPRVLEPLVSGRPKIPISFVGSFHRVHSSRIGWLERLLKRFEIKVWAPDIEQLSSSSPIRRNYMGPAWGKQMYQTLKDSLVTLNHHGNIPPCANNLRLYEATGVGTLLVTDWKQNLGEMFEPGKEVAAYRSTDECAELLQHFLNHADERETVSRAGQRRTLEDHTYHRRMEDFAGLVQEWF
jgi:spore maturation protein CgeB